ncbi:45309_t:CDS:2, partial [Gigaspora margarita]
LAYTRDQLVDIFLDFLNPYEDFNNAKPCKQKLNIDIAIFFNSFIDRIETTNEDETIEQASNTTELLPKDNLPKDNILLQDNVLPQDDILPVISQGDILFQNDELPQDNTLPQDIAIENENVKHKKIELNLLLNHVKAIIDKNT